MDIGLFVLRVVVGLLFAGHGAQKLFGAFGGHGLGGTAGFFDSIGMKPGRRNAIAAGTAELAGGVLLALGLLTPLATVLLVAVMVVAILSVHAAKGPWVSDGGWEYNVVLIAVAFGVTAAGPGAASLDNAFGWMADITGAGWAVAALAAGILGAVGAILAARATAGATEPAPATPTRRTGRFDRAADDAQRERPGVPADAR